MKETKKKGLAQVITIMSTIMEKMCRAQLLGCYPQAQGHTERSSVKRYMFQVRSIS
jgi:hypothetical protein